MPAGSVRRFEPTIGDLTLLAVAADPTPIFDAVVRIIPPQDIRQRSERTLSVVYHRETRAHPGRRTGRWPPSRWCSRPAIRRTCKQLHDRALNRGFSLDPDGLHRLSGGELVPCDTEADVYAALDLPYVPPELRHGLDELEATGPRAATRW